MQKVTSWAKATLKSEKALTIAELHWSEDTSQSGS